MNRFLLSKKLKSKSFFEIENNKIIFFNIIKNRGLKDRDIKILTNIKSFINKIVLSLYSHRFKIKSILFRNILKKNYIYLFKTF